MKSWKPVREKAPSSSSRSPVRSIALSAATLRRWRGREGIVSDPQSRPHPLAHLSPKGHRPTARSLLPSRRRPWDASSCSACDWASRRPTTGAALTRGTRRYEGQKCSQLMPRPPSVFMSCGRECHRRVCAPGRKCLLPCPTSRPELQVSKATSTWGLNCNTVPKGPRHTKGERANQTLWS